MTILRKLWAGWMAFARWLGRVQTVLLLSIVYYVVLGPTGLIARVFRRDLLGLRQPSGPTYWKELSDTTTNLERAHKQF